MLLEGYRHMEVSGLEAPGDETLQLRANTIQSGIEVVVATRTRPQAYDCRRIVREVDLIAEEFSAELTRDRSFVIEKLVAVVTDRDPAVAEPAETARAVLAAAPEFAALREEQARAWARLWRRAAITSETPELARAAALHAYHLLQTVSPHSVQVDIGLPSRGWQEAY